MTYVIDSKVVHMGWGTAFARAVPANMLVCVAVMIAYSAEDVWSKVAGMWIPIFVFAVIGLEHSIANMFMLQAALFNGNAVEYGSVTCHLLSRHTEIRRT